MRRKYCNWRWWAAGTATATAATGGAAGPAPGHSRAPAPAPAPAPPKPPPPSAATRTATRTAPVTLLRLQNLFLLFQLQQLQPVQQLKPPSTHSEIAAPVFVFVLPAGFTRKCPFGGVSPVNRCDVDVNRTVPTIAEDSAIAAPVAMPSGCTWTNTCQRYRWKRWWHS